MRLGGISLAVAGGELNGGWRPVLQERASTIEKMTYSYQIAFALTTTVRKNQNPDLGLFKGGLVCESGVLVGFDYQGKLLSISLEHFLD